MEDRHKTKEQLIKELAGMRQHLAEFEESEIHHKKMEEALSESEETFRLFMEHSPIYVFFKDEHIRSMELSKNYEKMLGRPLPELIGKTMSDLFPSDLAKSMVQDDLKILSEGKPVEVIEELNGRIYATTKFPILREGKPPRLAGFTMDITETKMAEKALRENEARFRGYFELPLIGFARTSPEKKWLEVNDRMCSMLGYSREELLRKTWAELTYPEDLAADAKQFNRLLAGAIENYSIEKRFVRKSGEVVWMSVAVGCVRDHVGVVKHVLALGMDITDRKEIEEALQRSEKEAKQLARENATIADIGRIISSTLDVGDVYDRFAEKVQEIIPFDRISVNVVNSERTSLTVTYISGISVPGRNGGDHIHLPGSLTEEVMRTRKSQIIQGEENRLVSRYPALSMYLNAGLCSMMSVPLISKDDVIGVLRLRSRKENAYADRDLRLAERVGDQIAGAIANAQLFNERTQAEDALLASETEAQRLAQENAIMAEIGRIINSSLDIDEVYERFSEKVRMLVSFDRISINIVNQGKRTITMTYNTGGDVADRRRGGTIPVDGTVAEKAIRTRSSLLIQGEDMGSLGDQFPGSSPTLRDHFPSMMMVPLISKDLVIAVLSLRSTRPHAYTERDLRLAERVGNQIAGAIANAQLFAEHQRTETEKAALEEQFRQSQKLEAIGRLAGGIAHDFNNVLTIIKGYSQLSLRGLNEKDPLTGSLREIFTAANRAADLTRQLLAFSRKQILEHRVLDLNQMIQGMEKMLRRLIEEDVELLIYLREDLGRIKADLGQIEQVIFNLAINARDAMPSGGSLILETDNVYLDEEYARNHVGVKPGHYVRLSISDTGHGMDAEVRNRAFDPFFTTKENGTGLGLSTVYGIVKQSEGHIWLYSEVGRGTTFKMFFPRVDEPADVLEENSYIETVPLGDETVLVLEDEDEVRNLVVQILKKQGYRVLEASNSGEAFLICEEHKETIHLILTDVVIPRMSGPEFIRRMRKVRQDFSVLYMSGYTDEAVLYHGVTQGAMDFIQKPFTYEILARKVRRVLDKFSS